jgi:hypothetical protein
MSKEHYISAAILRQLDDLYVSGFRRTPDGSYSYKALSAKILCREHNHVLSPLDKVAAEAFRILREMQTSLDDGMPPAQARAEIVDGRLLERWFLKVALGMIAAGQMGAVKGTVEVKSVRGDYQDRLIGVLFGRPVWPPWWGLYLDAIVGHSMSAARFKDDSHSELGLESLTHPDDHSLWGLRAWIRSFRFMLALGQPDNLSANSYRPRSLRLVRTATGGQPQILRLWWSKDGYSHKDITIERVGTRQ